MSEYKLSKVSATFYLLSSRTNRKYLNEETQFSETRNYPHIKLGVSVEHKSLGFCIN